MLLLPFISSGVFPFIFQFFTLLLGVESDFASQSLESAVRNDLVILKDDCEEENAFEIYIEDIYKESELAKEKLGFEAFRHGLIGYYNLLASGSIEDNGILTIVDYDKPSFKKRLFVIDIKEQQLLSSTLVAHGKNTGWHYTKKFSNIPESLQSSLGFFKTAETYRGKHGYSLRLDGLEGRINCKARERAIVMHGAEYVSKEYIKTNGRLGRSWGCPSVPYSEHKGIIDRIKDGNCLYLHRSQQEYQERSQLLDLEKAASTFWVKHSC